MKLGVGNGGALGVVDACRAGKMPRSSSGTTGLGNPVDSAGTCGRLRRVSLDSLKYMEASPLSVPSKKQFALFTRKAKNRSAGGQAIRVMAMLNRVDTKSPKIPLGQGKRLRFPVNH